MAVVKLKSNLRLFEAITIVVGSMIGSGILLLPADMAEILPSPGLILLVLVAGAALTVVGALTFAELAAMFPRAGGQYHFLKEGLGQFWSYLFGWTQFWVIQAGIIAGVAVAFARFLAYFLAPDGTNLAGAAFKLTSAVDVGPCVKSSLAGACTQRLVHLDALTIPAWGNAFVAIAVIALLAACNARSTRFGGIVQNVATVAKVAGLVGLVVVVFVIGFGDRTPTAYQATGGGFAPAGFSAGALVTAFGGALALSLFAFDGWPQATYVASEIQNPKRNLPLALIIGPLVTSAVYIALAAAYFYVIPIDQAVDLGVRDQRIAPEAAGAVLGDFGRAAISAVALVSVFGTVNGFILTAPRIFYAFSRDGAMRKSLGKLNRHGAPGWAVYFIALWASLLVMTGGYQQLVTMVVFGIFVLYIPTAVAHMRLRRTRPDLDRPYKTPLYPAVPIAFLLAAIFVVGVILLTSLAQALIALVLMLAGIPVYLAQRKTMARVQAEAGAAS